MEEKNKELQEYLDSALSAIKKGVEGKGEFRIIEPIEFDLAVVNTKEGEAGFKIYVLSMGGKISSEQISRIKIKVHPDRSKETRDWKASPPRRANDFI